VYVNAVSIRAWYGYDPPRIKPVSAAGKEQIIHVFRAGESFAEVALATDKGYPADARALETTQVLPVQKAGILALLRRQPELALRMLGSMSRSWMKPDACLVNSSYQFPETIGVMGRAALLRRRV
jgi:hypothetical protein